MSKKGFQSSLQETANKMMQSSAKVIGVVFDTHAQYIIAKEGREGLKRIEEKMAELGYPLKFNKINRFNYYPVGLADLVIVLTKEVFSWSEKDIFEMGNIAPKFSWMVKLFMKYFISLERSLREAPQYWRKHFTEGRLEYELHEKEKYVIIRLKYKTTHPLVCVFYAGYFLRIAQYVVRSSKISIKETECLFKGGSCHKYIIRWE